MTSIRKPGLLMCSAASLISRKTALKIFCRGTGVVAGCKIAA